MVFSGGYGGVGSLSLPATAAGSIDLEFGRDETLNAPPVCDYKTICIIPHKGQCTAATFSPDGYCFLAIVNVA